MSEICGMFLKSKLDFKNIIDFHKGLHQTRVKEQLRQRY